MRYLPILLLSCLLFSCSKTVEDKPIFDRTKVEYELHNDGSFKMSLLPSTSQFFKQFIISTIKVEYLEDRYRQMAYDGVSDKTHNIRYSCDPDSVLSKLDHSLWVVGLDTDSKVQYLNNIIDSDSDGNTLRVVDVNPTFEPHLAMEIDEFWGKVLWYAHTTRVGVSVSDSTIYMSHAQYIMLRDSLGVTDNDIVLLKESKI